MESLNTDYQKINTLFMRDEKNIIIPSMMTLPEFDYLKDLEWEATEKIDGTNMHLDFTFIFDKAEGKAGSVMAGHKLHMHGRTANAQIPSHLLNKVISLFHLKTSDPVGYADDSWSFDDPECKVLNAFSKAIESAESNDKACELNISVYGEGYGMKIQKGGGRYISNDTNFILFDVKVGDWWLNRADCEEIASSLGIDIVPLVGFMTIPDAVEFVKKGFKSSVSEDKSLDAEGLVLKTPYGLKFRNGQRIITKIKTCDFVKYRNVYGNRAVVQQVNPKYNK